MLREIFTAPSSVEPTFLTEHPGSFDFDPDPYVRLFSSRRQWGNRFPVQIDFRGAAFAFLAPGCVILQAEKTKHYRGPHISAREIAPAPSEKRAVPELERKIGQQAMESARREM